MFGLFDKSKGARPRGGTAGTHAAPERENADQVLAAIDHAITSGAIAEALRLVDASMQESPGPDIEFARARALFASDRFRESLWILDDLRARGWQHRLLSLQLGYVHLCLGHLEESERWMRMAVASDASDIKARNGLVNVLMQQRKTSEAIDTWKSLFGEEDVDPQRMTWIVYCEVERSNFDAAIQLGHRVLALDPEQPGVWINIGMALEGLGKREEALRAFEQAHAIDERLGSGIDAFVNVAKQSSMLGRLDDCLRIMRESLPARPSPEGHFIYAENLLKKGHFEEGWKQYEFRWMRGAQVFLRHGEGRPRWDGQDVAGKSVLVLKEQGVGDALQFLRYLPMLKQRGARVLLQRLPGLPIDVPGVDEIVDDFATATYDYYASMMSLPRVFGTTIETIPRSTPYLHADPQGVANWAARIGTRDGPNIGLVWAGNPIHTRDKERSVPLSAFAPLIDVPGARFYSLQKGAAEAELRTSPLAPKVVDLAAELVDFAETAAAIAALDLVIAVDTGVAHLAGALGRQVWLLVQKDGEWRWLEAFNTTSPWYPTMRIFRCADQGRWDDVIKRVVVELESIKEAKPASGEQMPAPPTAFVRSRSEHEARRAPVPALASVTETRYGVMQYFARQGDMGDSLAWCGEFLQPQLDFLSQIAGPGSRVLEFYPDIGAHALAIARLLGDSGHLCLAEPRALHQRVLRQNLAANHIRNVTVLRSTGVSEPRLDDLFLEQLHLLKVGTDADLPTVLAGARETLWRLRTPIFASTTQGQTLAPSLALLRECGYRCWQMLTPLFRPENFNHRTEDIFQGRAGAALICIAEEFDVDIDMSACKEL